MSPETRQVGDEVGSTDREPLALSLKGTRPVDGHRDGGVGEQGNAVGDKTDNQGGSCESDVRPSLQYCWLVCNTAG